jgi:hypothetical protein
MLNERPQISEVLDAGWIGLYAYPIRPKVNGAGSIDAETLSPISFAFTLVQLSYPIRPKATVASSVDANTLRLTGHV